MTLTVDEQQFWQSFIRTLPPSEVPQTPVITASFAGSPEISDGLLDLYLHGTKTAGSSLLEDFVATGDPVPRVGDYWIVLAGDGRPRCILRTTKVDRYLFTEVPQEVAIAEGEGDLSLAHWRRVHAQLYAPQLAAWGLSCIEDATVITEHFEMVYHRE